MLRILTASSILALAAVPAVAQQAGTGTTQPATETTAEPATEAPTTSDVMAPDASTDSATRASPAAPATADTPATPATPSTNSRAAQVAQLVDAEFPAYDANKNGDLDEPEFSKWLLALHAAGGDVKAKAMDEATKMKWAKDGFAAADADKDMKISKAEMNKFLAG
jgi:cytoskeletal protein RodZ